MLSATAQLDAHAEYGRSDGQGLFVTVWGTGCYVSHVYDYFDSRGTDGREPGWRLFFTLAPQEMGRTAGVKGAFVAPVSRDYAYSGPPMPVARPVVASASEITSDCTESMRLNLQNQVKQNCKSGKQACLITDNCPTLEQTMATLNACIAARTKINMRCFKGGDAGHREQIQHKINGLVKCQGYYFNKCHKPQPTPVPKPVPSKEPIKVPNIPNEVPFTLAGVGLFILYLISGALRPGPI